MQNRMIIAIAFMGICVASAERACGQGAGHGVHPPMPNQRLWLSCRVQGDANTLADVELKLPSMTEPATVGQVIDLPVPWPSIRVLKFMPRAELEQHVTPTTSPDGRAAVKLLVEGPTQKYSLWLVAGDPKRNQLSSLIGSWRFMHVKNSADRDRLHLQWGTEFTRDPLLRISRLDGSNPEELDARPGTSKILEKLGCKLRVLDFYPHFGFDQATSQPANQSPRRLNPAVRIQLEMDGKVDERWLFSKFPEYKSQKGDPLPFLASIDCASEGKAPRPDFAIVAVGDSKLECWMRNGDQTELRDLKAKTAVQVEGSQYTFQLDEFVLSGQLIETYQPVEKKGAVTVLCVEVVGEDAKDGGPRWLEMSKEATVTLKAGALLFEFGPRYAPLPTTQPDGQVPPAGAPVKPVHP